MQSSGLTILLLALFLPALSDAQEIHRPTRSLEEQHAISHISQAEYYTRMALRSLEASEKIGKAPYFNYQSAKEDIEKVLTEFKTYLKGDEAVDLPPAVPLIIDGRYFAESIKDFLRIQKTEDAQSTRSLPANNDEARSITSKTTSKNVEAPRKKSVRDKEQKGVQQNSTTILPPPSLTPQGSETKRDKIEEILKKGL